MDPSPSPPPSTVGLVRGDLCTSWAGWRGNHQPLLVCSQVTVPASFEDANDLTRVGSTPAPAQQASENKKDLLEDMLTGVFDNSPQPPSRSIKNIREKLSRTKSGLLAKMDDKPRDTKKAGDDVKAPRPQGNRAGKPSSSNSGIQSTSSKRLLAEGPSSESLANNEIMEKQPPGGTTIVDQRAVPAPSKTKKRKSPQPVDDGSTPRPHHKKQQRETAPHALNHAVDPTHPLASPQLNASSEIPPSGQTPVEDLLTENCAAQADTQPRQLGFSATQMMEEPETMDMDQGFEFESPEQLAMELTGGQQPLGVWTLDANTQTWKNATKPQTRGQRMGVDFGSSKVHIAETECVRQNNTRTEVVDPKGIIPRTSSPLFVSLESVATPLRPKQSDASLTTPQETQETELSTNNTTPDSSCVSETPPNLIRQHNLPKMPPSPRKIAKFHTKFLPAKKYTPFLSSEPTLEGTCTQPEGFSDLKSRGPEDRWKKATAEESLPAILHSIVTALHRSLKSKEDAIGDVAREYRENALQLLDAMVLRHTSDRIESFNAHEIASHSLLRAFSVAEKDMEGLVSSLRALDVRRAMMSVKHPGFLEKLERVCSLYDAKLGKYSGGAVGDHDVDEEPEEARSRNGKKCDEAMVNDFCATLRDRTQQNDAAVSIMRQKVHEEADRLLYGLPQHEVPEAEPEPVQEPSKKPNDVLYQALDGQLDDILDEFKMAGNGNKAITARDVDGNADGFGVISASRHAEDSDDSYKE